MKSLRSLIFAAAIVFAAPVATAIDINVSFSEDFAEKITDEYGEREGEYLTRKISKHLETELTKAGQNFARVDVVIEDAKPNRPTMKQLGDRPGLSFSGSISIGGMDLSAVAFDEAGNDVRSLQYDWYENDIRWAGPTTWYDANRASRRFASKFAKAN